MDTRDEEKYPTLAEMTSFLTPKTSELCRSSHAETSSTKAPEMESKEQGRMSHCVLGTLT